jgi:hypothetical protein
MKLLTLIINNKNKNNREYIAVSKRCCYLCELYINFARKNGYNIIISGYHKKIYSGWKLPLVNDDDFKIKSLIYILKDLNKIIDNKIKHYTRSLKADSDSGGSSPNPENLDKSEYMSEYYDQIDDRLIFNFF